jgi:ABC-type metal ion transport system substrate-binding protein
MNFRALNIRDAHERPEAMEEASVMMVGLNPDRILQALQQLQYQQTGIERNLCKVADYSMPNVSLKVARIILSYTDYIKRTVWSEYKIYSLRTNYLSPITYHQSLLINHQSPITNHLSPFTKIPYFCTTQQVNTNRTCLG